MTNWYSSLTAGTRQIHGVRTRGTIPQRCAERNATGSVLAWQRRQRIAPRVANRYAVRFAPLRAIAGVQRRVSDVGTSATEDAAR